MNHLFYKEINSDKKKINIILLHDIWDYHKQYVEFAQSLFDFSREEIGVTLIDIGGFGLSGGSRGHFENINQPCFEVIHLINKLKLGQNLFLMGNGLGSLLSLRIHQVWRKKLDCEISGLILGNPLFAWNHLIPFQFKDFLHSMDGNWGKIKVPWETDGTIKISFFRQGQRHYDPLICKRPSIRLYSEVNKFGKVANSYAPFIDIPTLGVIGSKEFLYELEAAERFFEMMDQEQLSLVKYDVSCRELFQNNSSVNLVQDVYNWINTKVLMEKT